MEERALWHCLGYFTSRKVAEIPYLNNHSVIMRTQMTRNLVHWVTLKESILQNGLQAGPGWPLGLNQHSSNRGNLSKCGQLWPTMPSSRSPLTENCIEGSAC
eukprot:1159853-Pelagomonas_calceolata.AAC.4